MHQVKSGEPIHKHETDSRSISPLPHQSDTFSLTNGSFVTNDSALSTHMTDTYIVAHDASIMVKKGDPNHMMHSSWSGRHKPLGMNGTTKPKKLKPIGQESLLQIQSPNLQV